MAEQKLNSNAAGFKEAVCIDAGRVYDSCSDVHCSPYKHTAKPVSKPGGVFCKKGLKRKDDLPFGNFSISSKTKIVNKHLIFLRRNFFQKN